MNKFVAGAIATAALVGGSAAIAVTNPLGIAGAKPISVQAGTQDPPPADPSTPGTTAAPGGEGTPGAAGGQGKRGGPHGPHGAHGAVLGSVLDELVKDGTITQEQADKITAKLKEKAESLKPGDGEGGPRGGPGGGPGGRPGAMANSLANVATALGMTEDEVKAGLREGKTIAQLATAKGVDPQKVIEALVAAATAKIDEAVAAGKLDAERATKAKEGLKEHIARFVNEGGKGGPGGPGGPGGRGGHGGPKGSTTTTQPGG